MKTTLNLDMPRIGYFTEKWNRVNNLNCALSDFEPKRVRIADLIVTQRSVRLSGLLTCDPSLRICVVQIGKKLYIRDGHHRTTQARILGKKTIDAWVLKLEDK